MPMSAIVSVDFEWGIGTDGNQLTHLTKNLNHFKTLTNGKAVVFGRKTLASLPNQRPLPNQKNYILSRDTDFSVEGATVCKSVRELCDSIHEENIFVIGGMSVYSALLPYCETVYVTKIMREFPCDCYFPNLDFLPEWREVKTERSEPLFESGINFQYMVYERIRKQEEQPSGNQKSKTLYQMGWRKKTAST